MQSLFLRIFLSFWIAMALGGLALLAVTTLTSPEPFYDYVVDEQSREDARAALEAYEAGGAAALETKTAEIARERGVRLIVLDGAGNPVAGEHMPWPVRRIARHEVSPNDGEVVFSPSSGPGLAMRLVEAPSGATYRVVYFSSRFRTRRGGLAPEDLALRGLIVVLVSATVCYLLARSLTSPLLKMRETVHQIASGNLSARTGNVLAGRRDEIAELGRDFDRMAERVEALVTSQQRLLADISHELRSPLARLGVAVDLAKRRGATDVADLVGRIEIEAARLDEMIGELLVLNRLESDAEIQHETLDLEALVREIVEDADFEAQSANRSVALAGAEPCRVDGDRDLLRRAVENVVRNAVRYTAEETTVEVRVSCEADGCAVTVRDRGPGVPAEDLENLFKPFYRVAGARERNTGGVGLGLAITERAVARHGGTVTTANAADGGLVVEIRLPEAPAA